MGGRINFAPRLPTIIVALVLMLIGLLGTFVGALPAVAGFSGETIGAWSLVARDRRPAAGDDLRGNLSTRRNQSSAYLVQPG